MNVRKLFDRMLFSALLLLFAAVTVKAQGDDFITIDWTGFAETGQLPRVVSSFRVGTAYAAARYSVKVEYPEYEKMNGAELRTLKKLELNVPDTLRVVTFLGVSRREGLLDVQLLPLIRRKGNYLKLKSCKLTLISPPMPPMTVRSRSLALQAETKASGVTARYAAHSVLSKGKWVKIRVTDDGVYSLTDNFIRSLGFSNPDKVKLYGYGGHMLEEKLSYSGTDRHYDDLEEVPMLKRATDRLFYANGTLRWTQPAYSAVAGRVVSNRIFNPYSSYAYYFLTEGDSAMSFPQDKAVTAEATQTLTTFPAHALIENDGFSWLQSGRNLYEAYNYADGNFRNYNLNLPGIDTGDIAAVQLRFSAGNYSSTAVQLTANGYPVGSFTLGAIPDEYTYATAATKVYKTEHLNETNTFNFKTTAKMNAHLDYIQVNYTRRLQMTPTFLPFAYATTGTCTFSMSGADSHTQIWRIGKPGAPTAVVPSTLTGTTLTFKLNESGERYVAVNTAGTFPSPEKVGSVANQDLHADSLCDMVIIVPPSGKLTEEAQRLAAFHRQHDSLRVNVVRADLIYNEFSSGTPDATAYRKYLKMLYDRATTEADMPKYLLLFGSCVWDNRMLTSATRQLNPDDYLLSYESDDNAVSVVSSYVTDDYFGLLDDGEGGNITAEKIDLGIGRIPVTTAADAATVIDKTISYVENKEVGNWKNNIYMMADDGNSNSHMMDAETVARGIENYNPALQTKRVYWDAYERVSTATGNTYPSVTTLLKNAMKKGALVMNYSGHGAPYCISHEQVLKLADFKEFSSARIPLWVVASCELTPYDMLEENIGETSLASKRGAAIAFYSAARAAYNIQNRYVNNYFMHNVLRQKPDGSRYTLGEAAREAKICLVADADPTFSQNKDFSINKLKYALMGDPAIAITFPTYKVVLDKLNGEIPDAENPQTVKAGGTVKVTGHIETSDGRRLNHFNGALTLVLQDSKDTITCRNNAGDDVKNYVYYERTKTLYEGSDSIRNGVFETNIPIPLDINYSGRSGRLGFYAVSNDRSMEANGYCEDFNIGGTADIRVSDSLGPKIFVYLNSPDFQDGGVVNETPFFYAVLSDTDGINRTGNGVGHDLELIIDGKERLTYVLNDYFENDFGDYTKGTVAFHVPALEAGRHRLFFRAWDMKNNASSTILNFVVQEGLSPSITDVKLSKNPASTSTTFIISYDRPETDTEFHIEVYDCFGRKWWDHSETAQTADGYHTVRWNLSTDGGVALPSGLYLYKVTLRCNGSNEASQTQKLIIHRQ